MRPVDPLHRKAERPFAAVTADIDRLQMPEQSRPAIPVHMGARADDVVALERGQRDGGHVVEAEVAGESGKILGDRLEPRLVEIDQIHLVDGKRDLGDAEQRQDAGVAPGLGQNAAAGIDQQHGEIAIRRAGRHVARVLHVAGRVGDDELAPRRGEVAIGDVDGDLLLAFGLQAVDQQRQVERRRLARAGALRRGALHLILVDQLGIVEQSADQRALAVIDAAAGEKAQQVALLLRRDPGIDPRARIAPSALDHGQARHQK